MRLLVVSFLSIFISSPSWASLPLHIEQWSHLDSTNSSFNGSSINSAHKKYPLKNNNQVIVAIIDSGVDITHEDLREQVWINKNEIPGNNIDDDQNGYIDDIFGWNFIGNKKGMAKIDINPNDKTFSYTSGSKAGHLIYTTHAYVRAIKRLLQKNENISIQESELLENLMIRYKDDSRSARRNINAYTEDMRVFENSRRILKEAGVNEFTIDSLEAFSPKTQLEDNAKIDLINFFEMDLESLDNFKREIELYRNELDIKLNLKTEARVALVDDNPSLFLEKGYGNNDVIGPIPPRHGTHVAGIIAANRVNDLGIKGVSSQIKIMSLKAIPNGDEHDKDIANAIHYAIDNGAKIINMSFGKYYSRHAKKVSKAIKRANDKGILIIGSAGNDYKDIDSETHYPIPEKGNKENWLCVGASSTIANQDFVARFSNHGQNEVDFFAPGVKIISTLPGNNYGKLSGTSMSAPLTTGIAALLLNHNPDLTPAELKSIIIKSLDRFDNLVIAKPILGEVEFNTLSRFPGIPNAEKALELLYRDKTIPSSQVPPVEVQMSLNF